MKSRKFAKSLVLKRALTIAGHRASISLEDDFWEALKWIAEKRRSTVPDLVTRIKAERQHVNLSSAIRLFVLDHNMAAQKRRTPRG